MTIPHDITNLQSKMSAAVREHWKAFLFEGILLVILGLAAIIVPPLASLAVLSSLGSMRRRIPARSSASDFVRENRSPW